MEWNHRQTKAFFKAKMPLSRRGPATSTLWKIIYSMQCLSEEVCSPMFSLMFLVYSTKHSAHSENGDQRMRQVVAYKQWKIINRQAQKVVVVAYRRWSFTRGSNCKALTGKFLVFWIGGHLWEVVAYERWSHMEVLL